ncbi:N-carbamoyl-L-amino-acid hydrolase [Xanthobacter flavus]|uniref:N-carbamoyl-L-amino-acid hydrolase n=1 Tax=Xanthobacter flavus TaxID=281 RepID=A0A9W6CNS6_XANFL|nr:Zn-dependent hydrolase [Xanthobacter flavus]MDR6334672.1 N-carbamoyl-L-amino-acid hydrolase [Xanthobacter flavus]GLI23307.1 Zn-dependent hydrolase [Xanthobacter flavus]
MSAPASNLTIDADRLWSTIIETAHFGGTEKGGVRRLTLSEEDRQVRDWFRAACEAAGCTVSVDGLGNMFALRPGKDMTKPPLGIGSHLDTQPTGGKFDGILGVMAALEVVRTLNDAGIETEAPICVCNWTNEEGSRFAPAMMGSAGYVADLPVSDILARTDAEGISVGAALDAIGYRGTEEVGARKFSGFLELHIEQGPILEAEGLPIGVVEHGQGIIWYDGRISGFESHTGSTPMHLRKDALAALSEIVLAIEALAKAHGPNAVGSVGEAVIARPSRNVIPGEIAFSGEFRTPDAAILDALDKALQTQVKEIAARRRVDIRLDTIWRKEPTHFDPAMTGAIAAAADRLGLPHRPIVSGAGHDSFHLATVVPTAMIFVPCKDGVSHNELESAKPEECAAGANVLLHAVLAVAGGGA